VWRNRGKPRQKRSFEVHALRIKIIARATIGRLQIMLRTLSFIVAVAAILAIPFGDADARRGGGVRAGGVHHFSGARFSGARFSGARVHSARFYGGRGHVVRYAPRRVFIGGHRIRHHRRFFFSVYPVGFYGGSCWRWRPTVYGWQRVWVCRPYAYPNYYYY
jgi:hypothetical protein